MPSTGDPRHAIITITLNRPAVSENGIAVFDPGGRRRWRSADAQVTDRQRDCRHRSLVRTARRAARTRQLVGRRLGSWRVGPGIGDRITENGLLSAARCPAARRAGRRSSSKRRHRQLFLCDQRGRECRRNARRHTVEPRKGPTSNRSQITKSATVTGSGAGQASCRCRRDAAWPPASTRHRDGCRRRGRSRDHWFTADCWAGGRLKGGICRHLRAQRRRAHPSTTTRSSISGDELMTGCQQWASPSSSAGGAANDRCGVKSTTTC